MAVRYPRLDAIFSDQTRSASPPSARRPQPAIDTDAGLVVDAEQRTVTVERKQLALP
ncbi:hypothetical protein [Kitasatospora sp. NPDC093102]|uniref:hypothetical protein n=1 Tax=Kitasatospora sp. NPDC093102 TaxID=3155069 RepID=UPI00341C0A51